VTIEFLGPLTLAAALSRRGRDMGWVLLAVTGVLTLGLLGRHDGGTGHSLDPLGVAFAGVAAASVVPYTLELAAMRQAPRRVFGILLSLEPAVAALAGWVLLGQRTPPAAIAAIALVILASTGATLTARASAPA
jgi:inner membrane transporter RhtA